MSLLRNQEQDFQDVQEQDFQDFQDFQDYVCCDVQFSSAAGAC